MAKKKAVVLRGIHIACHIPSEERLTLQIERLVPEKFRKLAEALEDYMTVVDADFREKKYTPRGRGWRGRGRKISAKSRTRVLRFSPFPSRFSNILKTIRVKITVERKRKCLVLEGEKHGRKQQNIYILPYINAPEFMTFIDAENREIDALNKRIEEFKTSNYFRNLKKTLQDNGIRVSMNGEWKVDHIQIDLTPLALEPQTVKDMVTAEYQELFKEAETTKEKTKEELELKRAKGIQRLQEELDRKGKELVVKGLENIQKKVENIVKRVVGAKKLNQKQIKTELANLKRVAVSVGLESIAETVIDPLSESIGNAEKTLALFGTKELSTEVVDARVKALIEAL